MNLKHIIGVMGPGSPTEKDIENATELGRLIAGEDWLLLNGGRNCGVMEASARGAKENKGTTIGILPDEDKSRMSEFIDIPILTGMGSGRNNINVLSSDIVVACGMGTGTASEIALALKAGKPVILLQSEDEKAYPFFEALAGSQIRQVKTANEAVKLIRLLLNKQSQHV